MNFSGSMKYIGEIKYIISESLYRKFNDIQLI